MSGKGSRFNWQESPAHLLLLSMFLRPHTAEDVPAKIDWALRLGEEPARAIRRFLDMHALVRAGLYESVTYRFKVTELRDMLRRRHLPSSGRKNQLVARLIQADHEAMKDAVTGVTVLKCSEEGAKIVEQYLKAGVEHPAGLGPLPVGMVVKTIKWILAGVAINLLASGTYDLLKAIVGESPSRPKGRVARKTIVIVDDQSPTELTAAYWIAQEIERVTAGEWCAELLGGVIIAEALPLVKRLAKEIRRRGDSVAGLLIDFVDETQAVANAGGLLLDRVKSDAELKAIPVVLYVPRSRLLDAREFRRKGASAVAISGITGGHTGQLVRRLIDAFRKEEQRGL